MDLGTGFVRHRFRVDGIPTGVCEVPSINASGTALLLVLQSENETGGLLEGVTNLRHRLQLVFDVFAIQDDSLAMGPWWTTPDLSFANGACVVQTSSAEGRMQEWLCFCANWNGNNAIGVPLEVDSWAPSDARAHSEEPLQAPFRAGCVPVDGPTFASKFMERPSDVTVLDWKRGHALDSKGLAVVDFYGGACHIFRIPTMTSASAYRLPRELEYLDSLKPSGRRSALDRPSAVAVDSTRLRQSAESGWGTLRVLIAETGAQCISIFEVTYPGRCGSLLPWSHLCDICTGDLGTGVCRPLSSLWSWLGLDVTPAGDILVTDMDQSAMYIV